MGIIIPSHAVKVTNTTHAIIVENGGEYWLPSWKEYVNDTRLELFNMNITKLPAEAFSWAQNVKACIYVTPKMHINLFSYSLSEKG